MKNNLLYAVFLLSISACGFPTYEYYYEPHAKGGEVRQHICNEKAGPFDTILLNLEEGVQLKVGSYFEKRVGGFFEKPIVRMYIDIEYPAKDVKAQFITNDFTIKDVKTGKLLEKKAKPISIREWKGWRKREENGWEEYHYYKIEYKIEFESFNYKIFELITPKIDINGTIDSIPSIKFERKREFVIYPLNC